MIDVKYFCITNIIIALLVYYVVQNYTYTVSPKEGQYKDGMLYLSFLQLLFVLFVLKNLYIYFNE